MHDSFSSWFCISTDRSITIITTIDIHHNDKTLKMKKLPFAFELAVLTKATFHDMILTLLFV